MKKLIMSVFFLLCLLQIVNSQTTTFTGVIKDQKGTPMPFVLVEDKVSKSAVYSDSLGHFSIQTKDGSTLAFSQQGYKDATIVVNDTNKDLEVGMVYDGSVKNNDGDNMRAVRSNTTASDAFSGHTNIVKTYNTAYNEGGQIQFDQNAFPIAKEKEEARGSRYFFKDWGEGLVINAKDQIVKDPSYIFNYDKMTGNLIVTHDQKSAITVDKDNIKTFTIINEDKQPVLFERFSVIDPEHFVQVLSDGNKYKILKLTTTKFVRANLVTNGITTSGNDYDEYVDESKYYLLNVETNHATSFQLKKKSIKGVFSEVNGKVEDFMNANKSDIDDQWLQKLGNFINN